MANRSYLYSSNIEPIHSDSLVLTGLSEWNYEIPLSYQILFSGKNSSPCKSLAFDLDEPAAIFIDYQVAIENLKNFITKISSYYSSPILNSALQFLRQEKNKGNFLVLEPYEIYILNNENISTQQEKLLSLLESIKPEALAQELIDRYSASNGTLFSSLLKGNKKSFEKLEDFFVKSGFREWSNVLCYAPYPPIEETVKHPYDTAQIVRFELSNLDSYAWFRTIEIDRKTKKVLLKEHRNHGEFTAELVDENRDINERLNFRFNISPRNPSDLMHVFSLLKGWGSDERWRLSSSTLEKKNGEITLRAGSQIEEYTYKEET